MRSLIGAAPFAAALLAGGTASAQVERLPELSRGEAMSSSINSSLANQGRARVEQQQNQFEVNSLRNELSRPVAPPPPVTAPVGPGIVIGR